jgi:selenocysteine lyase/cysteine desulfurase
VLKDQSDDEWFTSWRRQELERVDSSGLAYLDYTGAALYPASVVRADAERLLSSVLGNPHSEHLPSQTSSEDIAAARQAILTFLNATPDEYEVILTANTTGACRLVAESFPFTSAGELLVSADNHNSVNGIREYARRAGAEVRTIELDRELRLVSAVDAIDRWPVAAPSLFAFPAQSNFSGVRHPLELVSTAQGRGWRVLLDAASYLSTADIDLSTIKPDFLTLSLYKIAGYPTGVGALVARKDALADLRRPWFSGGTVKWASVQHQRHRLNDGAGGFEDGTPSFLAAAVVQPALAAVRRADRPRLTRHLASLTSSLLEGIQSLTHDNGQPVARIHGPAGLSARGATIAISLQCSDGRHVPYWDVESAARDESIAVRGGCFCNPGCAEAAFDFPAARVGACLEWLGPHFTVPRLAACLDDRVVGAVRVSMGLGSVRQDVERFLGFLSRYAEATAAA